MQPDDAMKPVVVREPYAVKVASTVLRGGGSSDASSLPSHVRARAGARVRTREARIVVMRPCDPRPPDDV